MSEWIECFGRRPDLPDDVLIQIKWNDGAEWVNTRRVEHVAPSTWRSLTHYRLAVDRQEPESCKHIWALSESCRKCGMPAEQFMDSMSGITDLMRGDKAVREGKQVTTCVHHPMQGSRGVYCLFCKETLSNAAQEVPESASLGTGRDALRTVPPAAAPLRREGKQVNGQRGAADNQRQEAARKQLTGLPLPTLSREQYENLHGPKREPAFVFSRDRFGFLVRHPELREVTRHAELPLSAFREWRWK